MGIEHTATVEGDLLWVRAWGEEESLEDTTRYGLAVAEAGLKQQCTKILCDEREVVYQLNTIETYKLAERISAQVPGMLRIAIVTVSDNIADAKFFEDTVVNRGLTLCVFDQLDAALAWLTQEQSYSHEFIPPHTASDSAR